MSIRLSVPPIKSQGIKTKLVPWINDVILRSGVDRSNARWIEPFFGTGVVGFNAGFGQNIVGDTNPHIINFYNRLKDGVITYREAKDYFDEQNQLLRSAGQDGYDHYRLVRDRFNETYQPLDFIFLSRAGFNGMMRFNSKGKWNIPFCKKPNRFAPAYVTKICNQIKSVSEIINEHKWEFSISGFLQTLNKAVEGDIIYCDPPYYGRYTDYYNGWSEQDEELLFRALSSTKAKFILSTWHHNNYRENEMIDRYWKNFNISTKDHFYHSGGKIENRQSVVEALVYNFDLMEVGSAGVDVNLFSNI